jgi:hypothetical protein
MEWEEARSPRRSTCACSGLKLEPGGQHHTNTETDKSSLYLFTDSFQVYMEGNAAPSQLQAGLRGIDLGTLERYD